MDGSGDQLSRLNRVLSSYVVPRCCHTVIVNNIPLYLDSHSGTNPAGRVGVDFFSKCTRDKHDYTTISALFYLLYCRWLWEFFSFQ